MRPRPKKWPRDLNISVIRTSAQVLNRVIRTKSGHRPNVQWRRLRAPVDAANLSWIQQIGDWTPASWRQQWVVVATDLCCLPVNSYITIMFVMFRISTQTVGHGLDSSMDWIGLGHVAVTLMLSS